MRILSDEAVTEDSFPVMRLLLLNGNTDAVMTQRLRALAASALERSGLANSVSLLPVTVRFGARYIASRAAAAVAAHAVLDAVAEHASDADAIALACFGDPGLLAAREIVGVPVHGMAEASISAALRLSPHVAVLTGGAAWVPMLEELVRLSGRAAEQVRIRAVPPAGDALARDPDNAAATLAREAEASVADGAEVVVLGGAGLAGLASAVRARVGVPVLDSLECLVAAAVSAPVPRSGAVALPGGGVASAGLSSFLTRALAG